VFDLNQKKLKFSSLPFFSQRALDTMWACCLSRKVDCSWLASRAWGLRNIRTGVNSKNYGLKSALLGQNDLPKTSGSNIALQTPWLP